MLHVQGYLHHLIELQLAHQERDQVSEAYNHATHLKERRAMRNACAAHLDKLRMGGDVIALSPRAAQGRNTL